MKKSMKRYLAMLLAMTLVLQQGGTITLADENEPASETVVEKTTETQVTEKQEEKKPEASEPKQEETKEPESKAPETKPETPKTEENKTPETKPEETNAPDTQTETQKDDTAAEPESSVENTTEQATESETVTEGATEGETQTPPEQEKESEKESEFETEQEEEAKLDVSVMQEVYQKTVDDATVPMVKYTVKLTNKAETADAEGAALKVLLANALSYKKEEGETPELVSFDTLGNAIEATAFEGEELNEEQKSAYANGNVVLWKDQTIAAGAEKTYVFCAEVKDGQTDVNALKNLWLVNGEAVAEEKLQWTNTELLAVERPSEFVYEGADGMIVTAVVSDPTAFPEGTVLVAEPLEVTDEDLAAAEEQLEEGRQLTTMLQYDIRFEKDGLEIEPPEGVTVDVSIAYNNAVELGVDPEASGLEMQMLHEKDNGEVEEVEADASISEDGYMDGVQFVSDSFSTYKIVVSAKEGELAISLADMAPHSEGKFYICVKNTTNNNHVVAKVTVQNGKITEVKNGEIDAGKTVKIAKVYEGDGSNASEKSITQGEEYTIEIFEAKTENQENEFLDEHKHGAEKRDFVKKKGDYFLGSNKITSDFPITVQVGGTPVEIGLEQMGSTSANKSTVVSSLGKAMNFGAFVWSYIQSADVESTIAAHMADIEADYNFMRQNEDIDNTITVTKQFSDQDGNAVSGQSVTVELYRVTGESERKIGIMSGTTDSEGRVTFTFNNASLGGFKFLLGGTYKFYEVVNGNRISDGDTFEITKDGRSQTVTASYSSQEIFIDSHGFDNYSYFEDIADLKTLEKAREGSFVVLGPEAWKKWNGDGTTPGWKETAGNSVTANIVPAGTEGFDAISFTDYFGAAGTTGGGSLASASSNIADMCSSADTVVYYVKASDLYKDMKFSSQGGKFIIVNVDTTGADSFTIPNYTIDNASVSAEFGGSREDTNILWNLYNIEGESLFNKSVVIGDGDVTGTVLLPEGSASIGGGNLGGRVIARNFTGNQSEIHETIPDFTAAQGAGSIENVIGGTKSTKLKLTGTKAFDNGTYGDAASLNGYEFAVEPVTPAGEPTTYDHVTIGPGTITSGSDGKFTTPWITFEEGAAEQDYYFKVTEKQATGTTDNGVVYSEETYLVKVTVGTAEGKLAVKSVSVQKDGTGEFTEAQKSGSVYSLTTGATFTNSRKHGQLSVTKEAKGATPTTPVTYTVEVKAKAGTSVDWAKVVEANSALKSSHALKAAGDGVSFTFKAGETVTLSKLPYGTYTVTESGTDSAGNTFETKYTVDSGTPQSACEAVISSESGKNVTITNTYKSTTDVTFSGTKYIEGIDSTEKVFTFELYETGADFAIAGKAPIQTKKTQGKIEGSQKYAFEKITYDTVGTYYYVVKEQALTKGEEDGFQVDTTVYHITVAVTADSEGRLSAAATVTGGKGSPAADKLDFTNRYSTTATSVTFSGTKFIEGVESTEVEFTFELQETDADFITKKTGGTALTAKTAGTVSGSQSYKFAGIEYTAAGTHYYVVKEIKASVKDGFVYDTTEYHITVEVKDVKGKLSATTTVKTADGKAATTETLDFTNEATTASIALEASKSMADPKTTLKTYEFEVVGSDGKTIATAKNDASGKVTFGNIATYTLADKGKTFTYTVKEKLPANPDGTIYDKTVYTVTVTVSLDETGKLKAEKKIEKDGKEVSAIEFTNDETHLSILKVDEDGNALAGARLVLKDANDTVKASWTTTGEAYDITGLPQGSYTLSELEAPKGYQVSKDVPVEITDAATKDAVLMVPMTDKTLKPTSRSLRVTKELSMEGISEEAHIIVREATYYVALFEDEARTERVTDVKKIVFANQESSYVTFDNLEADKTYYIGETDEYGTVIPSGHLTRNLIYYPTYDNNSTFKFEGDATEGLAGFTNVYVEWPDYFYLSGQLTVTKQVLLGGEECDSDDVFYARIFNDARLRDPVSDEVLVLDMAGGNRTSVTVTNLPIGDKPGSSRKYYVAETDEYGNPLDPDEVTEYTISVDKSEITLDASNANPEVVITNDFHEEESEFESESEVDEKKTAPKTGEDTDYAKYLFLLTLSAGTCAVLFEEKRRKAKRVRK